MTSNCISVASNYLSDRAAGVGGFGGGGFGGPGGLGGNVVTLGGPSAANNNGLAEQVGLYRAQLSIPLTQIGRNTELDLGRIKHSVTPLTYYRPDTDAYFDLPWYDDGNWVHDGFRLQSKFGSATTSLWAGSFSNLTTTSGAFLNRPLVGATVGPFFTGSPASAFLKPTGLNSMAQGAFTASQVAGIHIGIPVAHVGELGVTTIDVSGSNDGTGPILPGTLPSSNLVVYGVNAKLNPLFGHFVVSGEAAKSVTQFDFSNGDGTNNDDNNAYLLNVGYNSGPLNATVGYQYYDPRYSAPGYWNKIGNWYNPTNVQGPFARVTYGLSQALQFSLGGDFLSGARNRPGFTIGSSIGRATAGAKYRVNRMLNFSADYEGVFYDLSGATTLTGNRAKPVEQYITFGAGVNLSGNTVLKLAYQLINTQDVGSGLIGYSPGGTSNASVFNTSVAVHF